MKRLLPMLLAVSSIFMVGCATSSYTKVTLDLPSHYSTQGWVYDVGEHKIDVGIVFIHGKSGSPGRYHNDSFISKMRGLGYQVIAPLMPWSELRAYEGTRAQGLDIINAAVDAIDAQKVVVVGHSMGGMAVLQYGARGVSPKVIGLITVAPGHDPGNSDVLRIATEGDANTACKMVADGKGKERRYFKDMNQGVTYSINATAEYYCTLYSINEYPDSLKIPAYIKTPIFIISGAEDRLTHVYLHHDIYDALPANSKNKYEVMSGGHLDVMYKHTDAISKWIDSLSD